MSRRFRVPGLARRSVRFRLTLAYGLLFLFSGAVLLVTTYTLVDARAASNLLGPGVQGRVAIQQEFSPRDGPAPPPPIPPPDEATMHDLSVNSALALGLMTVVSIGLGWVLAGRMLRPLRTITGTVRHISATNLHRRLAMAGPHDELRELGDTFDDLLRRLEASFRSQRQFVANASHELRTPLARQRTLIQVALSDPDGDVASLRAAHERSLHANRQQERLIEALLTLAEGEAGPDRHQPVDLAGVTDHVLLQLEPEAVRRGLTLHSAVDAAHTSGNPHLVERLVTNLVDNALRHNVPAGRIEVHTGAAGGRAVLTVVNTGPVVPPSEVDRLLQPFQRLGTDRTSRDGGFGLGLSIVQAIANAHRATLAAEPAPAGGIRVTVSFPSAVLTGARPMAVAGV